MVEIILINPAIKLSQWELKLGSKLPPIGLLSIAGYLRRNQVGVRILDAYNMGMDSGRTISYVIQHKPSYVGFTATSNMINSAALLAKQIKKQIPKIVTIIGGSHLTALPEETMELFPSFDIGVYGEGEETLFEIINKGKVDETVHGIVYRDDGIIKNPPRTFIKNLDNLPFPAYDLLPKFPDLYRPTPNNYKHFPVVSIVASRGCPYSCTFCSKAVFGSKIRTFTSEYLLSLIDVLQSKYKIKEVCFFDDIFLLSKDKMYDFIERKERSNMKFTWSCEVRIGQCDDQMYIDMKKAECWQVNFGVESGSQEILDYFSKKISVSDIKESLASAAKAKLKSRAYLIVGSPPETVKSLEETKKIVRATSLNEIVVSYFTPMPGTVEYQQIDRNNKADFGKVDTFGVSYVPSGIDPADLKKFTRNLYLSFYFHPKRLLYFFVMVFNRHKSKHLIKSLFAFLKLMLFKRS